MSKRDRTLTWLALGTIWLFLVWTIRVFIAWCEHPELTQMEVFLEVLPWPWSW